MVYQVQGNVYELFQAFDQAWMIKERPDTKSISADLPKTRFLGNAEEAKNFATIWKTKTDVPFYIPGNMSAGNLFWLLGDSKPLIKKNENRQDYEENFVHQHFAFINEAQEPCALMMMYRRDEPSQWVLGLVKNTHLAPERRNLILLSGFDLSPHIKTANLLFTQPHIDSITSSLRSSIDAPFIQDLVQKVINPSTGAINIRAARMNHLLRLIQSYEIHNVVQSINKLETGTINFQRARLIHLEHQSGFDLQAKAFPLDLIKPNDFQPELLFADNCALDLLAEYKILLSSAMLKECLSKNSGLKKEIESLSLSNDEQVNRYLLQMTILFYEENILEDHRSLLDKYVFIKTRGGYSWDFAQIQLIPFLLKNGYKLELFTLILSKSFYYNSILTLIKLGYIHDIPKFLASAEKCRELEYIEHLKNEDTKKLCLIFWAKSDITLKDYYKIVEATEDYPLLAKTLIKIDQTEVTHIKNLKAIALAPLEHQKLSLMHLYASYFGKVVIKDDVKQLKTGELTQLIKSLDVLKKSGTALENFYVLATKNNKPGLLLRLFLPSLEKIGHDFYRQELVKILYIGIKNGPVTQAKTIQKITDNRLASLAKNLNERFICAKQIQDLGFNNEMITLAAEDKGVKGSRFRKIILQVEAGCKRVQEQLHESRAHKSGITTQWQKIEKDYRRTLYSIAYDGLTQAPSDIRSRLKEAEIKVLQIVDPQVRSELYTILILIANTLILALSMGIANHIKARKTGNYWFFNQTSLGEQIRVLDQKVNHVIESPEPASVLVI